MRPSIDALPPAAEALLRSLLGTPTTPARPLAFHGGAWVLLPTLAPVRWSAVCALANAGLVRQVGRCWEPTREGRQWMVSLRAVGVDAPPPA
jgi:hypothetical protein